MFQDENVMMRYIIAIIILITLFSLFSLFEKPPVIQHYQKQTREVVIKPVQELKDVKETSKKVYFQDDMEFLINAYGVGNS